ncbi:MAG: hypothetical protein KA419_15100 [Acidobacteria bacterium]|nr:hypothetical protein [Acidobacteriota bacterium]
MTRAIDGVEYPAPPGPDAEDGAAFPAPPAGGAGSADGRPTPSAAPSGEAAPPALPAIPPDAVGGPTWMDSPLDSGRPALDMHFAGVLLLLAFILPLHRDGTGWEFTNLVRLGRGGFAETFSLGFPLAAGLSLLALAKLRRPGAVRGSFLVGLGLLPFVVVFTAPALHDLVLFLARLFMPVSPVGGLFRLAAGFVGFFALYAGLRGALIRPGERVFRFLAFGGAVLMLGLQVLPVRVPFAYAWGGPASLPEIAVPFHLLFRCRSLEQGIVAAGQLAGLALLLFCLYRALGLCIRRWAPDPRRAATQGFVALWARYIVELLPALLVIFFQSRDQAFYDAAGLFKVLVWVAGVALIVPVGLTDLLLGTLPPGPAPLPANEPPGSA